MHHVYQHYHASFYIQFSHYMLAPKIPWSFVVWAACVKKNNFFSIFPSRQVNYIFHKLSVNTKHAQFRLRMSLWRIYVENGQ
jgi:hypothetical protein